MRKIIAVIFIFMALIAFAQVGNDTDFGTGTTGGGTNYYPLVDSASNVIASVTGTSSGNTLNSKLFMTDGGSTAMEFDQATYKVTMPYYWDFLDIVTFGGDVFFTDSGSDVTFDNGMDLILQGSSKISGGAAASFDEGIVGGVSWTYPSTAIPYGAVSNSYPVWAVADTNDTIVARITADGNTYLNLNNSTNANASSIFSTGTVPAEFLPDSTLVYDPNVLEAADASHTTVEQANMYATVSGSGLGYQAYGSFYAFPEGGTIQKIIFRDPYTASGIDVVQQFRDLGVATSVDETAWTNSTLLAIATNNTISGILTWDLDSPIQVDSSHIYGIIHGRTDGTALNHIYAYNVAVDSYNTDYVIHEEKSGLAAGQTSLYEISDYTSAAHTGGVFAALSRVQHYVFELTPASTTTYDVTSIAVDQSINATYSGAGQSLTIATSPKSTQVGYGAAATNIVTFGDNSTQSATHDRIYTWFVANQDFDLIGWRYDPNSSSYYPTSADVYLMNEDGSSILETVSGITIPSSPTPIDVYFATTHSIAAGDRFIVMIEYTSGTEAGYGRTRYDSTSWQQTEASHYGTLVTTGAPTYPIPTVVKGGETRVATGLILGDSGYSPTTKIKISDGLQVSTASAVSTVSVAPDLSLNSLNINSNASSIITALGTGGTDGDRQPTAVFGNTNSTPASVTGYEDEVMLGLIAGHYGQLERRYLLFGYWTNSNDFITTGYMGQNGVNANIIYNSGTTLPYHVLYAREEGQVDMNAGYNSAFVINGSDEAVGTSFLVKDGGAAGAPRTNLLSVSSTQLKYDAIDATTAYPIEFTTKIKSPLFRINAYGDVFVGDDSLYFLGDTLHGNIRDVGSTLRLYYSSALLANMSTNGYYVNPNNLPNLDFNVGGTADDYLLHVDAGLNRVGINAGVSPSSTLDVGGTINAERLTLDDTAPANRIIDATVATNIYNDINFGVSALQFGPTAPALVYDSGPSSDLLALEMDPGDVFMVNPQMNHTWVTNTTVYPHIHWQPQVDTAYTNTYIIGYSVADIGDDFPATTYVTNTIVTAAGNQWAHIMSNIPTNGIPMTGFDGPSTVIRMRVELDASNQANIHVTNFDVHYRWGGSPVPYSP